MARLYWFRFFLIYYGLGQFTALKESFLWDPIFSQAYWCAIIAFTLNTSAYIGEIVRGAVMAVPTGELEAADAIGMSKQQKITPCHPTSCLWYHDTCL